MPALRVEKEKYAYTPVPDSRHKSIPTSLPCSVDETVEPEEIEDCSICDIVFPLGPEERKTYRNQANKAVTSHHWDIYDIVRNIPCGKVVTYKDICVALGSGSPRSVGSALRNNPFAPFVPCHRIIASTLFIGGFYGEWGMNSKTGTQCNRKLDLLRREGVRFDSKGFLADKMYLCSPSELVATRSV